MHRFLTFIVIGDRSRPRARGSRSIVSTTLTPIHSHPRVVDFRTDSDAVEPVVKLRQPLALTNQIAWGKVSLKSLEITAIMVRDH